MSNWMYIGMAYGLTYVTLAGYWVYLRRRTREVQRMLEKEAS
jgi:hypothetical protein